MIWNLGEFSVNSTDPWRVTVTADSQKSVRSAVRRPTRVGSSFLTSRAALQIDSVRVALETFEYSAMIELCTRGFEERLVILGSRR